MFDRTEHAKRIAKEGQNLNYEQEAIDSIVRCWEYASPDDSVVAMSEAQVWATLHLARMTKGN